MLRRLYHRRGAVLVLAAISLVVVVGVAALTLEGGLIVDDRRRQQAAADASALAAADDLFNNYSSNHGVDGGTAAALAKSTAAANGYPSSDVAVHIPPTTGIAVNKAGYAEIIITTTLPRGFSAVLGSGQATITARAVARGQWVPSPYAILVLDPTRSGALTVTGNGKLTVTGGPVLVDSNNTQAAISGGNGSVTAPTFTVVGGISGSGFHGTVTPQPVTATPDPLAYLPTPNLGSLSVQSNSALSVTSTKTLKQGVYKGGIQISGQANVTMQPGIYYMEGGGFSVAGKANVTASGVMIYNAPVSSTDAINIAGQGNVTISPITTGLYQGISIFQDPTSTVPMSLMGNGVMNVTGTIYAARALLTVAGNGSSNTIGSQYDVYDLSIAGNGSLKLNNATTPLANARTIGLVE